MSSTMQERDDMIEKSAKAGYNLSYTMYIMEEMIDFIKNTKGKSIDEKMELLKTDRWLGTSYLVLNNGCSCVTTKRCVMIEMIIVGTIGIGYAVVGTLQWLKGDMGAGIMWLGYSFAQIGLFINLK
jgi:hypothetical protein